MRSARSASRQESLQLAQVRESGGVTSLLDVRQAEQLVYGAAGEIAGLEREIAQQENFISVLLGNFPASIARGRDTDRSAASRPRCRRACRRRCSSGGRTSARRAGPRRGQRADRCGARGLLSTIALTGGGGLQSTALGRCSAPARFLVRGRQRRAADLHRRPDPIAGRPGRGATEEATLAYERTVKQAFREVSDALVGYTKTREFRTQQEALTIAAQDARRLADIRYRGGATSYLEVLDADTRLFVAELALAESREAELSAFVEVYRALGGGWQQEGEPAR